MKLDGFSTLYMDKLAGAEEASIAASSIEDEMVGYLPHCTFNLNPRAASHRHAAARLRARARMSTTCTPTRSSPSPPRKNSKELTKEIFGGEIGWLPWKRPGFELGLRLREVLPRTIPTLKGVMLESHGLFTWGDTAKACYETTLDIINTRRSTWLERKHGRQAGLRRREASRRCQPTSAAPSPRG